MFAVGTYKWQDRSAGAATSRAEHVWKRRAAELTHWFGSEVEKLGGLAR